MTKKRWFGARLAAGSSELVLHAVDRLLARSKAASTLARACANKTAPSDYSADASWTASLRRGGDLPPCRLSILTASGSRSAMRFEPYSGESDPSSPATEI